MQGLLAAKDYEFCTLATLKQQKIFRQQKKEVSKQRKQQTIARILKKTLLRMIVITGNVFFES